MTTSYFGKLKYIEHPIAICGWVPEFYTGKRYIKLAPKKSWFFDWKRKRESGEYTEEQSIQVYKKLYDETVLSQLDPHEVYKELCEIYGTDDVTLICYERPNEFCHRHLVAEWLNNAGYDVHERPYRFNDYEDVRKLMKDDKHTTDRKLF